MRFNAKVITTWFDIGVTLKAIDGVSSVSYWVDALYGAHTIDVV